MTAVASTHGLTSFFMQSDNRTTRINADDLEHMNCFPVGRKRVLMDKIMAHTPAASHAFTGNNHYEKAILRLRKDGYQLIDLQPQEHVFISVWRRQARTLIGLPRVEVAMLLWMTGEESTNLTLWRL